MLHHTHAYAVRICRTDMDIRQAMHTCLQTAPGDRDRLVTIHISVSMCNKLLFVGLAITAKARGRRPSFQIGWLAFGEGAISGKMRQSAWFHRENEKTCMVTGHTAGRCGLFIFEAFFRGTDML